jgi:hypothetical protein
MGTRRAAACRCDAFGPAASWSSGHPATRVVTSSGVCKKVGADRTIQVVVETSPTPSPLTYFTGCLRGPNLAQNERRVDDLLVSARISSQ